MVSKYPKDINAITPIPQTKSLTKEFREAFSQMHVLTSYKSITCELPKTVHFDHTEIYLQDNEFILLGYRTGK